MASRTRLNVTFVRTLPLLYLLNVIMLFTDRNNRRIEDMDYEERISNLAFFVDVIDHLSAINRAL
jgi:hypothetical protein